MMIAATITFVIVLWALSTAAIFYLDSLPPRTFPLSFAITTILLCGAGLLIWTLRGGSTSFDLILSFAAGLFAWGWTEMALYMGYITGPRKHRCAPGCSGATHFGHAIQANLWHELVVIAFAAALWLSSNTTAFWCFTLLWLMHLSARLNVFLGVRNVSEEFVPEHMNVLKGFLRKRNMNPLFPVSCALLLFSLWYILEQPQTLSTIMAATLVVIGLAEHILLMLPLPVEKLWRWSLSKSSRHQKRDISKIDSNYKLGVQS
jgi:putative photosynthetic complex assembly protein 2